MGKTKLTMSVDTEAFEATQQYASKHGTTIDNLVEAYFRSLVKLGKVSTGTPILNELAGSLKVDKR